MTTVTTPAEASRRATGPVLVPPRYRRPAGVGRELWVQYGEQRRGPNEFWE